MAEYYSFVDARPVTEFVPPSSSKRVMEVRGKEPHSGIYFLSLMSRKSYLDAAYRNVHMNALGRAIYQDSLTPHVIGISVRQTHDAQNMLRNELDVDVESSSGQSADRITLPYPRADHVADDVAAFRKAVAAEVALLDSAENAGSTGNAASFTEDLQVVTAAERQASTGLSELAE